MNLYIKQKLFSWGDRFTVYDAAGNDRFYVEGEILTWGKKLHLQDLNGCELAFVCQELFTFLPRYQILQGERELAQVVKEFTFFKETYTVEGPGWQVQGDFWDHEYEITRNGRLIASVSKQWLTWGDTYEIRLESEEDIVLALAVVLVIDACIEAKQN